MRRIKPFHTGDTLVEVILAFAIFSLVAVATNGVMNRGVALAEQSLEITLVREQIDAQAELLRYAHSVDSPAWDTIKTQAALVSSVADVSSLTTCPTAAPDHSFVLSVATATSTLEYIDISGASPSYAPAVIHSQFDASYGASDTPMARGIWVVPVIASSSSATVAYDMHIGACWNVPGYDRPSTLGTIVRLYDTI